MKVVNAARRRVCLLAILAAALRAQSPPPAPSFTAPAGIRQAMRREGASILPGGRIVGAFGREYPTGPGPFAIALSPTGHSAAIANTGPWRYTITVLDRDRVGHWEPREIDARSPASLDDFGIPKIQSGDWRGISNGIAFSTEHAIWVSEGNSGRVALYDSSEERRRAVGINDGQYSDSYTSALAYDPAGFLYVADQANARVAVIETKSRQVIASVHVGPLPCALTLSPDHQKLYVANLGVFNYHLLPNVNASNAATAGLPFPAPWPATPADSPETNSLAIVDVSTPATPKLEGFVKVGFSPSAVVAAKDEVFVSCANDDSIAIVNPPTHTVTARIPLQIPGLEQLRGIIPLGMAFDEPSGWLLVAEAGINAVAVIDTRAKRVLGHIPTAWYPTSVALDDGEVIVATARGHGIGPDAPTNYSSRGSLLPSALFQGSVAIFKLPAAEDLAALTESVMRNAGFAPSPRATPSPLPAPPPIHHVVLIVKEGRTFDELLGDLHSSPRSAMNDAAIARYGLSGFAEGGHTRLSLKGVRVTPNTHAIATQFAYSDNFYADGDGTVDGHHWLQGVYPNAWTRSSLNAAYGNLKDFRISAAPGRLAFPGMASSITPEDAPPGANLWDHLASHQISFFNFGEGFDLPGAMLQKGHESLGVRFVTDAPMPQSLRARTSRDYPGYNLAISDQLRATAFIKEAGEKFAQPNSALPQFTYIYLPGDAAGEANLDETHPFKESFIADNDLALGRILEYLSSRPDWRDTAVFVTESTSVGGIDHISANRTLLLAAGPWVKHGYVSHMNVGFPGLLKTIFWLLGAPPLNLFDASAADLHDCFATTPNPTAYKSVLGDERIFKPAR